MKRIWFPGLIALIIIGGVYFYFFRGVSLVPGAAPETAADLFAGQTAGAAADVDGQVANPVGPQQPTTANTGGATANNQNLTNDGTNPQKIMNAILHTNMGDITIEFNPSTPKTTENFIKLAQSGFYNGTKFHRVIK